MRCIAIALVLATAHLSVLGHWFHPGGIIWNACNRPNEKYDCGSACQRECKTLNEPCPIINVRCNDGCYCKDGYARDDRGNCIPEKYCPPKNSWPGITWITCNRPNEKYDCGSACQRECKTLNEPCPIINKRCNDGCYCIDGYARDDQGICILEEYCPPKNSWPGTTWKNCNRLNEKYDCGSACQTECKTLNEPCPIINVRCNDDCYCIDGYARDDQGNCILEEYCPPKNSWPGKEN